MQQVKTYHFGVDPIETTPNWYVVHYMYTDEIGDEYYGRQFFDTLEDAKEFVNQYKES